MEQIHGVVERITYQNEENGYSVIKCRVKNYQDLVTIGGAMAEVHVGSVSEQLIQSRRNRALITKIMYASGAEYDAARETAKRRRQEYRVI